MVNNLAFRCLGAHGSYYDCLWPTPQKYKSEIPTVKASISFTANSEENVQERLSEHLKQIEKNIPSRKLTLRGKTPENQFSWKMTLPFGAISAYFQRLLLLVSGSVFIGSK